MKVVGVAGGPDAGGRTSTAIAAVLTGAASAGALTDLIELGGAELADVVAAIDAADAVVFGSPVYRATYSALLKTLLEGTERGRWGERTQPLQGKVAATVITGASGHHFLATNDLRNVLAGFFAVQVLSPGLYFDHGAYVDRGTLTDDSAALAAGHGAALVDLATAVRGSAALSALVPQV
ncbi:NAD(P)H-dependent oxidoreductase [Pseudonocardia abyssalis]|uniref:NAD(P)H-dependent oxidoreductase n=1 Tax=Pseudonocardia abyssalis TaxID=2792008 RepID=A0ABS6UMT3_9PSEU|nr:NAD(P)H-dependent oxidoreductase [Pseudonocardia abyssalis]MBW0115634.1 NAD(P)H-dependent oxidoreductase [Pseudonocardia abyssalis]MBW0133552.1 NAD(P)H-dependent oxidoreductase [Pseudonocardia abyssalis]